jgi:hypothetical protein
MVVVRMRWTVLPVLLLLGMPAAAQHTTAVDAGAAQALRRAESAQRAGDEARATKLAREVLDGNPDDAAARALLGYRRFEGRWRLPQEIAYLERAASARGAPKAQPAAVVATTPSPEVVRRIERLQRRLYVADERSAVRARDDLVAFGRREGLDGFDDRVEREFWRARLAVREARAVAGRLSVRVQHTRLLGFDTVNVGFGNGTGRVMLPRTESISIGGSIPLPLR